MSNSQQTIIAVDLGASSGRLVAGHIQNGKISLEDVHRFENGGVKIAGRLQWDLLALWANIKQGLRKSNAIYGTQVMSVGVDTWAVDFGLLDRNDQILGNPYTYRDEHVCGMLEKAFEIVSREDIFAATGLQFMEFNTLYQLLALKQADSAILEAAESFLMMPDLFHWLLSGEKSNEQTNASTTQFYNPQTGDWASDLLSRFDLPTSLLQPVTLPGTKLGTLQKTVQEETGLQNVSVILPGSHDTASAVMAVPKKSTSDKIDWCYISSGTWSLMGVESPGPLISDQVRELNFTNEAGIGGTTRLLKNIGGLWLVQECRRVWAEAGKEFDFGSLVEKAAASEPLVSIINPDHPSFAAPQSMPQAIAEYCKNSGQSIPQTEGAIIRTALESLALRYRQVLGWLETIVGNRIDSIHIVGGGIQNKLLCQMAADACNRVVIAGPVEATAIGNIMMQAVTLGIVDSISQAREVVRNSFDVTEYTPQNSAIWDDAYARFETF